MRRCARCKKLVPFAQMVKNRSTSSGFGAYCKPCACIIQAEYKASKGWVKRAGRTYEQELRIKARNRLANHLGLSHAEVEELQRRAATEACELCGRYETKSRWKKLFIDHDHQTKKVRGLLCMECNTGLGKFKDSPELLRKAANYLEKRGKKI